MFKIIFETTFFAQRVKQKFIINLYRKKVLTKISRSLLGYPAY